MQHVEGPPVATVELWFRAPATGFQEKPVPSLSRFAAEAVVSSKPLTSRPLGAVVSELGGRINVSAYADSLVVSALVPASSARDVVSAMTRAFFAPVLTDDGFAASQRKMVIETTMAQFDPDAAVHNAVFRALFSDGVHREPPLGTPRGVQSITADQVRTYAQRAFRSQNAVLVVSGAVDAAVVQSAADGRPATPDAPASSEPFSISKALPSPQPTTASFSDPMTALGWIGPPIASQREATALDFVADYLFRPESGVVTKALAQSKPDALVSGQFITLHDPGVFLVSVGGKDVADATSRVQAGIDAMRAPLPKPEFARALSAFEYHMLSDIQTVQEVAENYGWYATQGNPAYAPGTGAQNREYMSALRSLTPEFVAKTVNEYLKDGTAVTLRPAAAASPAPGKNS